MQYPEVLQAFTHGEYVKAHALLASQVARMMGRKLEEGDWANVYCAAKGIENSGWSNLKIDINYDSIGVEHKMLRVKSKPIKEYCGTRRMHPSATRAIRIPSIQGDPTKIARDVLSQYADFINQRHKEVAEQSGGQEPDVRIGWLLWQESLREFLYFEEEMLPPNPDDYYAIWKESGGGSRRASKNLWVYEKDTDRKRYSITTRAGAKIQPYFDIPAPTHPNLYYFRVQGEVIDDGMIRIWVTVTTALLLETAIGSTDPDLLSERIIEYAEKVRALEDEDEGPKPPSIQKAKPILITIEAYEALREAFSGVSDEHMMQLFVRYMME